MEIDSKVIQAPSKLLTRLALAIPVVFLLGVLFYFFIDQGVGISFFFGGVLALIAGIIMYIQLRRENTLAAQKSLAIFFIASGIVLLVLSLAIVLFDEYVFKRDFSHSLTGMLLLIYGIIRLKSKAS